MEGAKMKKIIALLATVVGLAIFSIVNVSGGKLPSVGYVLVGPKNDGGWSMRHSQGFDILTKYGYNVTGVESVVEADSGKVFAKLARKNDIVFGTSFGFMKPMVKVAAKNPDTIFMHATGYMGSDNMDNYVCRGYQARYLTGVAAGLLTKTNNIGVVGSHPIPEIVRNINAIALGARSVNPKAKVNVIWINAWFDPPKDTDASNALYESGNDVLYTTGDIPSVVILAEKESTPEKPIWSMGNDAPMNSFGPNRIVTGVIFNWNLLYKEIVDKLAAGKLEMGQKYFRGLKEGCAALSPWGLEVPQEVSNHVDTLKMRWINDMQETNGQHWDELWPFSGGYNKRDGTPVAAGSVDRHQLDTMGYYVEGIAQPFPTSE
jgi:basic membrane protein A